MQTNPDSRGEIFVVDDDAAARATLAGALTGKGFELIYFADTAALLVRAKLRLPRCVFLDLGVRDNSRFALLERIRAERWRAPVFASAANASIPMAIDAVRRGAFDFIPKPFDARDIAGRIDAALGEAADMGIDIPAAQWDGPRLTVRESAVLERIALGESNKEIAQQFGLSSRTVEYHRANILRKAGVRRTNALVRRIFDQRSQS